MRKFLSAFLAVALLTGAAGAHPHKANATNYTGQMKAMSVGTICTGVVGLMFELISNGVGQGYFVVPNTASNYSDVLAFSMSMGMSGQVVTVGGASGGPCTANSVTSITVGTY